VAVGPDGLDGVSADRDNLVEPEGSGVQGAGGSFVQVPEHVALALAAGAGTGAAQGFETQVTLGAVILLDGEFVTDVLDVRGAHDDSVADGSRLVHARGQH